MKRMKVSELVEALKSFDQNAVVSIVHWNGTEAERSELADVDDVDGPCLYESGLVKRMLRTIRQVGSTKRNRSKQPSRIKAFASHTNVGLAISYYDDQKKLKSIV